MKLFSLLLAPVAVVLVLNLRISFTPHDLLDQDDLMHAPPGRTRSPHSGAAEIADLGEAVKVADATNKETDVADTTLETDVADANNDPDNADHEPKLPLLVQPIASIDDPNTFAGCLLIMDDNHFLIEWLAYHYHVMPLRRLIVLVDPHSRTTPEPILDRWKDKMTITLWHEKDIFPRGMAPPPDKKKNTTKLGRHRIRQRQFVSNCLHSLKKEGREWVVLTDTDEYTMINERFREPMTAAFKLLNATVPLQEEAGSVMKLLKQNHAIDPVSQDKIGDYPCITMSRREFATRETKDAASTAHGYTTANLQTLNWRYYSKVFKPGKALLNLQRVTYEDLPRRPSVHRPIHNRSICIGKVALNEEQSIFAVNHYPGNLDQMLFRDMDARGDAANATAYRIERFNNFTKIGKLSDPYGIQDWLPGFIAAVGEKEAHALLENAGLPREAATFLKRIEAE